MRYFLGCFLLLCSCAHAGQAVQSEWTGIRWHETGTSATITGRNGLWTAGESVLRSEGSGSKRLTFAGPDLVEFRGMLRIRFTEGEEGGRHGGLIFHGEKGDLAVHFWPNRVVARVSVDNQSVSSQRSRFPEVWPESEDSDWNEVRFVWYRQSLQLVINGNPVQWGQGAFPDIGVVRSTSLYAHRVNIAVESLEAGALDLAAAPASAQEGPVFTAGLDGVPLEEVRHTVEDRDLFAAGSGTVMFWYRPEWDSRGSGQPARTLLTLSDENGGLLMDMVMAQRLRVRLMHPEFGERHLVKRGARDLMHRGDGIHVAVVWNDQGWNRLYVNGIPYEHVLYTPGSIQLAPMPFTQLSQMVIGGRADGMISEVHLYNRPLNDGEVQEAYGALMPVEPVLERRFVPAGQAVELPVLLLPGSEEGGRDTGGVTVSMHLEDDAGRTVRSAELFQGAVRERVTVTASLPPLEEGLHRLRLDIRSAHGAVQRTTLLRAFTPANPREPRAEEVALGEPVRVIRPTKQMDQVISNAPTRRGVTADGSDYLEAGGNKFDRFSFEIRFPEEHVGTGRPVMLEFLWPDDRPRSMGWYLYPEARNPQHRDRLGAGIQSGNEFPVTGEEIMTRHLFYLGVQSYLFEARTMVEGMPAAVSEIRVRTLEEVLPELALETPEGYPARRLGFFDEDQTFQIHFNYDDIHERSDPFYPVVLFQRMAEYFAYTGQNLFSYPFLRYDTPGYAQPGHTLEGLHAPGHLHALLDVFGAAGIQVLAAVNLRSVPELSRRPDRVEEHTRRNYFALDRNGRPSEIKIAGVRNSFVPNIYHPEVRDAVTAHIMEVMDRFGDHPAFLGIDLWTSGLWGNSSPLFPGGLEFGYDDFTVQRFEEDTGLAVPGGEGPDRFEARWKFLTEENREIWIRWRARQNTEWIREIRRRMSEINPDRVLVLNTSLPQEGFPGNLADAGAYFFEHRALDLPEIRRLPNVRVAPMRHGMHRWQQAWDGRISTHNQMLYSGRNWNIYRQGTGPVPVWSFAPYFESFNNSLDPERFPSYFQNADVKSRGRYFLKEWAFNVAQFDSDWLLLGGQPVGTLGRERETREFARAFRALPATPFQEYAHARQDLTVRYYRTETGMYLYLVNTSFAEMEARLVFTKPVAVRDLSGDLPGEQGPDLEVSLKPYQLRSFFVHGEHAEVTNVTAKVSSEAFVYLRRLLDRMTQQVDALSAQHVDTGRERVLLDSARALLASERMEDALYTLTSTELSRLELRTRAASRGYYQKLAAMEKEGVIAVNCGARDYFLSSDGTLFQPDRAYDEGSFGYVGPDRKSVVRTVARLQGPGAEDPELFSTESYDFEGYRFTVPNGIYEVTLYMRTGFERNARPGWFLLNIDLQGTRVADRMDLFLEQGGVFEGSLVRTFGPVDATDGVLRLDLSVPEGHRSSTRLCNAIKIRRISDAQ